MPSALEDRQMEKNRYTRLTSRNFRSERSQRKFLHESQKGELRNQNGSSYA